MAIAILLATRSRLIYPIIAIGFITGLQASDKGALLFSFLAIAYLLTSKLLKYSYATKKFRKIMQWSILAVLITIVITIIKHGSDIKSYFLRVLGERYILYTEGYGKLFEYFLEPSNNIYSDAGVSFWWHSVPLDAIRAAGFTGAFTSLLWFAIIVLSAIVFFKRTDYRLIFLSLAVLFIYMTSLPLHTGAYEFMGLATGTILIINEIWKKSTAGHLE